MSKRKHETVYVVTYATREDGAKMLAMLKEDGRVGAVDCDGVVGLTASESQLRRLTKAGVNWRHIGNGADSDDSDQNGAKRARKSVRTARHRR